MAKRRRLSPLSYLALVAARPSRGIFVGARALSPLQASQVRLAFACMWMRARPPLCADVMELVGARVRGSGGLNALLHQFGIGVHKAMIVRLLTDVLADASPDARLPSRYSALTKTQQLEVLARAATRAPRQFCYAMCVVSSVPTAKWRRVMTVLRRHQSRR